MEKKNNIIGRPKKNTLLNPDCFFRVVDEPLVPTSIIEFYYTDPFEFRKYLNTFKSNHVDEIWVVCKPNNIYFCGNVESKPHNKIHYSNENCSVLLKFNCNNVFRYYCKEELYLLICEKDFMTAMISEIGESTCEVGFVIDSNITNRINVSVRNSILRNKQDFNFKCEIMPKNRFDVKILRNTEEYCYIDNINIIEHKKMLSTKFKKGVNESRLIIQPNTLIIKFYKNMDNPMEARIDNDYNYYNESKYLQQIKFFSQEMISMVYPRPNIILFLLHIKGHFSMLIGNKVIILKYRNENDDVVLESHIGVELN
jgi:hypothetical protein